jgi:hypothetical protein
MSSRRRRRDRRGRHSDHPEPSPPPKPALKRADVRRRAEFEARMKRIRRTRTVIGFVGFLPLFASLFCAGPLCAIPREIYLGLWAAIFGTFLGLTIRMWRERREFARQAGAPA